MAWDFRGESPQGRMISLIFSTGTCAISCGVEASAKSAGVTVFTRASVHCADSSTATKRV